MFKLKLQKIKANEWRTFNGQTTELKRGHVIRVRNSEVYVVFEVYTSNSMCIVDMNEILKKDKSYIKRLIVGDQYRVIGQQ